VKSERPRLRADLPFQRIALVLAGGGAFGAYEVGVLRTLEAAGLKPSVISGVSVGAINAVLWLAYDFKTAKLEKAWRHLRGSSLGMRWLALVLKGGGIAILVFAALEVVLTLAGSPQVKFVERFARLGDPSGYEFVTLLAESLAWALVGIAGFAMVALGPQIEDLWSRLPAPASPDRIRKTLALAFILGGLLYIGVIVAGIPWPWRVHGLLLVVTGVAWFLHRPGQGRDWVRDAMLRLLPETRGRGLWRGGSRQRLIERMLARGDASRLTSGEVHLIISACAIADGRVHYFVNWPASRRFVERIEQSLGQVVELSRPKDVIGAVVASSTVPVLFEPQRFRARDYFDAGLFSNQPLHAVVADGADAILLVLVSPSSGPRKLPRQFNLIELVWRIQELSNWRDLQTELARLPPSWRTEGKPARICIVEPERPLAGAMFSFDPASVSEMIQRGEADAWRSLEQAGWLES